MGKSPIERFVSWVQWLRARPKTCKYCGDMLTVGMQDYCSDEHAWQIQANQAW